jgi:uncharacterized protein YndB with AHSA1/START domain
MDILKKVGLGFVGLVVVLAGIGFALPRTVDVERSIVIAAQPEDVFPYLNSLKMFNQWSPWAGYDPDTVYVFSGPETGKGAKSEWSSDHPNVGSGSQEITESQPNTLVRTNLDFGAEGVAHGYYKLSSVEAGTLVIWGFETDMGASPVGRYMGLMMDKWVGGDFEVGLANLKTLVEAA